MKGLTLDKAHVYRWKGQIVPGVGKVLREGGDIVPDSKFYAPEHALRGTNVHTSCELDDQGVLDEDALPKGLRGYLRAWQSFRKDYNFTPMYIEEQVYDDEIRVAGMLDRIGLIDDAYWLVDIKSGQKQPYHPVQVAGYIYLAKACMPWLKGKVLRGMIVYVGSKGNYRAVTVKASERSTFLACATLYWWRQK